MQGLWAELRMTVNRGRNDAKGSASEELLRREIQRKNAPSKDEAFYSIPAPKLDDFSEDDNQRKQYQRLDEGQTQN